MKRLTTIALMGALTFGAVSAIELTSPTTKVAAVQDNWPYKYFPELHNVDDNERLNFGNLKHGQTITVNEPIGGGDSATIKIYRVMDDFSLARYKTIEDSGDGKFTTPITSAYDPGNYVAVMQYTFESEGKFSHYYTTGNMFTISK